MTDVLRAQQRAHRLREIASELQAMAYLFTTQNPLTHEASVNSNNEVGQGVGRILGRLAKQVLKLAESLDSDACRSR
jgi:hypothetical protein